ncbi:MAG: 4a-hydroxytetrahydrobiopterin dehydratase [Cyanobacteria bacterium]|nr:4a-hydroxytetrahydrobiopterin dehydratase [Cyanobacteriota bacterium]
MILSNAAIQTALLEPSLTGWQYSEGQLSHTFQFKTFNQAVAFANQVAAFAEAQDHHPDIHIFYNKVKLDLISHDVKGITTRDIDFAKGLKTVIPFSTL